MQTSLFLIFNHNLTDRQRQDAHASLGVDRIVDLPGHLKTLWRQIPPDVADISGLLGPIADWLRTNAQKEDFVLVQGDFGAVYRMVDIALGFGLVPVYSTTRRQSGERHGKDGVVDLVHRFRHVRFRRYKG
ncbi:MAG: hypothetical protein CSA23_00145 [Deltaproteobacteria bacterium]|nr:MAG: hypothetical protein CSA23_00145 [Deltaproteobacteria bacterium]